MILFTGDILHAGATYKKMHHRMHFYCDKKYFPRKQGFTFFSKDQNPWHYFGGDGCDDYSSIKGEIASDIKRERKNAAARELRARMKSDRKLGLEKAIRFYKKD